MTIRAERSARWLDVVVHDDGRGLPDGFSLEKSDRLGLQIVRTLVSAELDGSLGMHDVPTGGHRCGAAGADRPARRAWPSNRTVWSQIVTVRKLTYRCAIRTKLHLHTVTAPTFAGAVASADRW